MWTSEGNFQESVLSLGGNLELAAMAFAFSWVSYINLDGALLGLQLSSSMMDIKLGDII